MTEVLITLGVVLGYLSGATVTGGTLIAIWKPEGRDEKLLAVFLASIPALFWPLTWVLAAMGGLCWIFAQVVWTQGKEQDDS